MENQAMDLTIAAAIGALAAIFFGALIALVLVCKNSRKKQNWERLDYNSTNLKKNKKRKEPELALALCDIGLGTALEQIINNQQWVDDVSGLIPHCLSILRTCHSLTEMLAKLAMTKGPVLKDSANRLIEAARRIPSRVDDVVQAMYPPLDPRLLEARMAALVLAVGQLALLTQSTVGVNNSWIDKSLQEMDQLLTVLREACSEDIDLKYSDYSRKFAFV
ncbi:transmembrane protein 98-like [Condylostylus longicornis]|uniref:transmembrane protein 98-like n=1 Tax=Condylostylus longicornis TaxID=2530218 RepID=UPI00244E3B15|nr:transmembrane protein 98-like [Condylostylus longicornis]